MRWLSASVSRTGWLAGGELASMAVVWCCHAQQQQRGSGPMSQHKQGA